MREPVVIRQDEQTEIHVQAVIQSGRRQLDIRVWRRGPTGFAPSQSALTLEATDVDALCEGITELLEASDGGRQVARVVWDKDEGRRLRAETEPFGTRFVARLGFWQRVRDTWRPADAGLVLAAEQLDRLREIITALRPRLQLLPVDGSETAAISLQPAALQRWPSPGADWLTTDPDRLAFHPRGIRITAVVQEHEDRHCLEFQQWRRHESLWLPEDGALLLAVPVVDALLSQLREVADNHAQLPGEVEGDDCTLRLDIVEPGAGRQLRIEERAGDEREFVPRLVMPADYLPRFGRMLAQAGMLLISHLSAEERAELREQQGPEIAPAIVSDALVPEQDESRDEDQPEPSEAAPPGPAAEDLAPPPARRLVPLGEVQLGRHFVFLYMQEESGHFLSFQWDGYTLLLAIGEVQEILEQLRDLYYAALRGRRGQIAAGAAGPPLLIGAHSQGSATIMTLEQEAEGKLSRLTFPAAEVPTFLNAATTAMKRIQVALDSP